MKQLLKMERYQLSRNRLYWYAAAGIFLLGLFTAETYVPETMGPAGKAASSLTDILDGMIYDSTFLLVIVSSLLAYILGQEFSGGTIGLEVSAGHRRGLILAGKVISYLTAFNLIMLVYPLAGCIREFARFGLADANVFLYHFIKAALYSFLLNSAVFLVPILCCFRLQNASKALAVTAFITFVSSLYLGYGLLLELPVRFLPTFQIREALTLPAAIVPESLAVAAVWVVVLSFAAWYSFHGCDLK